MTVRMRGPSSSGSAEASLSRGRGARSPHRCWNSRPARDRCGRRRSRRRGLARKVARLRVFEDEEGRFDAPLLDEAGEALVVSQFTLIADTAQGKPAELRRRRARRRSRSRSVERFCAALARRRHPGRDGCLRRADERLARQRRTRHDRPRLSGHRPAPACGAVLSCLTAFHRLDEMGARSAHFC